MRRLLGRTLLVVASVAAGGPAAAQQTYSGPLGYQYGYADYGCGCYGIPIVRATYYPPSWERNPPPPVPPLAGTDPGPVRVPPAFGQARRSNPAPALPAAPRRPSETFVAVVTTENVPRDGRLALRAAWALAAAGRVEEAAARARQGLEASPPERWLEAIRGTDPDLSPTSGAGGGRPAGCHRRGEVPSRGVRRGGGAHDESGDLPFGRGHTGPRRFGGERVG